jgi:TonB family protein
MLTTKSTQVWQGMLLALAAAAAPAFAADLGHHKLGNMSSLPAGCKAPQWPAEALQRNQYGMVSMKLLVEADGKVGKLETTESSGYTQLDKLTEDAIARCVFAPHLVDGKPVASWTQLNYVWTPEEEPTLLFDAEAVRDAARIYKRRAQGGDKNAQYVMGDIYRIGHGFQVNFPEAASWYRKSAEQGHMIAQYNLAMMYAMGVGVTKNVDEAALWMRKAAEQGHADAQDLYGGMVEAGRGAVRSEAEALEWYRKSAMQGNPHGQFNLAQCYEFGIGIGSDQAAAADWYARAQVQGVGKDRLALMRSGTAPKQARGVPPNTVAGAKPAMSWTKMPENPGDRH